MNLTVNPTTTWYLLLSTLSGPQSFRFSVQIYRWDVDFKSLNCDVFEAHNARTPDCGAESYKGGENAKTQLQLKTLLSERRMCLY